MGYVIPALALALAACGSDPAPGPGSPDAAGGDALDAIALPCPTGHILGPDGKCMAVGIQGCAEMFIDPEDGLCKPSMDHCPKGQIPIFSEGCQVVGIPDCIDMFIDPESGLCDPKPEHCPPGSIPIFSGDDQGCQPVGIPDCHPDFIDPESGLCDPDPDFCEVGYIPVPTQGCVSLDPPGGCGEGTWGNVEELAGDVHVDPGYFGGSSDGSRDHPWTLIGYALGDVQAGGRVVLAAGEYDTGVLLAKTVSLVGRCTSMVTLAGTRAGAIGPTVVEIKGDVDVFVSDVTVSGLGMGLTVHSGARLVLARARLVENRVYGLTAALPGTTVSAQNVLIARTQFGPDGTGGRGVGVEQGALVFLERTALLENRSVGLYASGDDTLVQVADVVVAHTQPEGDGVLGHGVFVQAGVKLDLERVGLVENQAAGLLAAGPGTTVTAQDILVARTQQVGDGTLGRGMVATDGAALTLNRASLVENHKAGLFASELGTTVTATDILISRSQPQADGSHGRGIHVQGGAALTLSRASLVENHELGLFVASPSTSATVSTVLVARTHPRDDGTFGRALGVQYGASLSLTRASLLENHGVALLVGEPGTAASVTDSLVSRTRLAPGGTAGRGIQVQAGAALTLQSVAIIGNLGLGLLGAHDETRVEASRVLVASTQPRSDGSYGRGMAVQEGATLSLDASSLVANHDAALVLWKAVGQVTDSLLEDTVLGDKWAMGDGLLVTDAWVDASAVVARSNARAGIFYYGAEGEIQGCLSAGNQFGLIVQGNASPDVSEDVFLEENDVNLLVDGSLLVPTGAMAIPELPEFD